MNHDLMILGDQNSSSKETSGKIKERTFKGLHVTVSFLNTFEFIWIHLSIWKFCIRPNYSQSSLDRLRFMPWNLFFGKYICLEQRPNNAEYKRLRTIDICVHYFIKCLVSCSRGASMFSID